MKKIFVFDAAKCNGCFSCQIACKDEHCGNDWMPFAKPQPQIGHFWCKGSQKTHGQTPKVKLEYHVQTCNHCENPACMKAASEAVYKREDGLVIIDPVKAQGMKSLVDVCPYGNIYWNDELDIPQKCTGCAHLVDAGESPRCIDACQTHALRWIDEDSEEAARIKAAATPFDSTDVTNPRMYYINLPKLFIAGDVWDPESNEVLIGATVTLTAQDGNVHTAATDDFGDFWFKGLDAGTYGLKIQADGFKTVEKSGIELSESLNLGDFPLEH